MSSASLRALLAGAVDYAGLFPPASLTLEPALRNHAAYLRDADVWMLGAFVLPKKQFEDASAQLANFSAEYPLRISALGGKSENAAQFMTELNDLAGAIRRFNPARSSAALVTQIEIALPTQPGVRLTEVENVLAELQLPTFLEALPDDAERTINFLAAGAPGFGTVGFKLRTGGVIASAFPSSIQIARALVAAVANKVPIKFTAGLHHPVRQFHRSVQTRMHGFLNVLGAGVLAAEHRWSVQQTARMLDDEDATAFQFDDAGFAWNDWKISTEQIKLHRRIVTSFGSCSFDEPREDLRALELF